MIIKQISIFIENRQGRLAEVTDILGKNDVNIRALSIADTTDFGILRIIVDDPDRVINILKENNITASTTSVLSVIVDDRPGGLAAVLRILADHGITVEYMYAYISRTEDKAFVVMRTEKEEEAEAILSGSGYSV
ncbi:MAG: ACT domain-containing protein [Clostridia bacterium]|nr:ACT domain-containing protein [Clostridia bacterium]